MDNKLTIKERILLVAKYKGFTLDNFCNRIGLTYGNFKGNAKKTPINSDAIVNILTIIPDINIEWLLTGEGPMLREVDTEPGHSRAPETPKAHQQEATPNQACAQCAAKDKIIASQEATIEAQKTTIESQKETIKLLKRDLEACGRSKKPPLPDSLTDEVTAKLKKD